MAPLLPHCAEGSPFQRRFRNQRSINVEKRRHAASLIASSFMPRLPASLAAEFPPGDLAPRKIFPPLHQHRQPAHHAKILRSSTPADARPRELPRARPPSPAPAAPPGPASTPIPIPGSRNTRISAPHTHRGSIATPPARPPPLCSIAFAPHPECPAFIASPRRKSVAAPRAKNSIGIHNETIPTTAKYVKYMFSIMRSPRMSSLRAHRRGHLFCARQMSVQRVQRNRRHRQAHPQQVHPCPVSECAHRQKPDQHAKSVTLFGVQSMRTFQNS